MFDGMGLNLDHRRLQCSLRYTEHPSLHGRLKHMEFCRRVRWRARTGHRTDASHQLHLSTPSRRLGIVLPQRLRLSRAPPRHLVSKGPKQSAKVHDSS
jgi:hypothetical protein